MLRAGVPRPALWSLTLVTILGAACSPGASIDVTVVPDPAMFAYAGGPGDDGATAAAPMPDGGFVVTGWFLDAAVFDPGRPGQVALTAGASDGYLARHRADGSVAFVATVEGPDHASVTDAAVVADGIFVCGTFHESAILGRGQVTESRFTVGNPPSAYEYGNNAFIAKYSFDGELLFARHVYSQRGNTRARRIVALPDGGCLFEGVFELGLLTGGVVTAAFHAGEPNAIVLTANVSSQGRYTPSFLARYTSQGQLRYARAHHGGPGLIVTADGGFAVAGPFHDSLTFGAGTVNEATITVRSPSPFSGPTGSFLARYDQNGEFVSVVRMDGTRDVLAGHLVATADGFLLDGRFDGTAEFGIGPAGPVSLSTGFEFSGFIAGYGHDLSFRFVRSHGRASHGIAHLSEGSFAVLSEEPPPVGEGKVFRCLLCNRNGVVAATRLIGGGDLTVHGIGALADGSLFACGSYAQPTTFGSLQIAPPHLGMQDIFLATYRMP